MVLTKSVLRQLWAYRSPIIILLTPLLSLPLPILINTKEARCAYGVIIMAIYWMTEVLPVPVTSLLPVVLFPMLRVVPGKDIAKAYINDTSMLFIGGLILSVAIEHWKLHKRIALRMLLLFGSEPPWLLLGLMLPTWFLSMWISNTATAAMMMPIGEAVLRQLKDDSRTDQTGVENPEFKMEEKLPKDMETVEVFRLKSSGQTDDVATKENVASEIQIHEATAEDGSKNRLENDRLVTCDKEEEEFERLGKAVSLCIAYAANIGGTGTLTGTGPNIVLKGQADQLFQRYHLESGVTFATWMLLGIPLAVVNIIITWIWLQIFFLRCRFAEIMVLIHFGMLALLWLTRDFQGGGWGTIFGKEYVTDGTAALLISILLFITPSHISGCFRRNPSSDRPLPGYSPLLSWNIIHEKFPWGIVILLGGGFALANASKESGLSSWVGENLSVLGTMEPWVMSLVLASIVAAATEVTSNTATATLLMPIMAELALSIGQNPLYLMFPTALACSFAFMLPVATPPNAIVFSHGRLKVLDMASAGFMMNILCVFVLTLAVHTWGEAFFHFHTVPLAFYNGTSLAKPKLNKTS